MKKYAETLLDVSKEVGLDVNMKKLSIYSCFVTRLQDKTKFFKSVTNF
jgi:hypothetical protein